MSVLSRWPPAAASTASMGGGVSTGTTTTTKGKSRCDTCGTTVYPLERVALQGRVFHDRCARCATCNCVLTASNFAPCEDGRLMCLPHYRQRFAASGGRYSFGSAAAATVAPSSTTAPSSNNSGGSGPWSSIKLRSAPQAQPTQPYANRLTSFLQTQSSSTVSGATPSKSAVEAPKPNGTPNKLAAFLKDPAAFSQQQQQQSPAAAVAKVVVAKPATPIPSAAAPLPPPRVTRPTVAAPPPQQHQQQQQQQQQQASRENEPRTFNSIRDRIAMFDGKKPIEPVSVLPKTTATTTIPAPAQPARTFTKPTSQTPTPNNNTTLRLSTGHVASRFTRQPSSEPKPGPRAATMPRTSLVLGETARAALEHLARLEEADLCEAPPRLRAAYEQLVDALEEVVGAVAASS